MTDEQMRELFREMRDEAPPADSLARVRMGLAARIARGRWIWAGVLGLIPACVLLAMLLVRTAPPPRRETAKVPAPAPEVLPEPVVRPAIIRPQPRRVRRRVEQAAMAQPAAIRIETDDPNVVILLVGNE
ncbi:MAG: hypothetical protein KGN84_01215 [Acidobacteriota bacterium]|nr:hypothetical protein [Acidobacteriota bacterium]